MTDDHLPSCVCPSCAGTLGREVDDDGATVRRNIARDDVDCGAHVRIVRDEARAAA